VGRRGEPRRQHLQSKLSSSPEVEKETKKKEVLSSPVVSWGQKASKGFERTGFSETNHTPDRGRREKINAVTETELKDGGTLVATLGGLDTERNNSPGGQVLWPIKRNIQIGCMESRFLNAQN